MASWPTHLLFLLVGCLALGVAAGGAGPAGALEAAAGDGAPRRRGRQLSAIGDCGDLRGVDDCDWCRSMKITETLLDFNAEYRAEGVVKRYSATLQSMWEEGDVSKGWQSICRRTCPTDYV